ncbi:UNVERIFIED_ORG: hypothetical protein J2W85_002388 [Ensifer adhaerens]|nr:hypothetical protein [Ensifer adhaerens]
MASCFRLTDMPNWMEYLKSFWNWVRGGIPGDIRSALVGSAVASVTTIVTTAFIAPEPLHFAAFANAQGYTQPLKPLAKVVSASGEMVEFEFQPPELRETYVCEFAQVEATSHRQLMLSYLGRYPTCFAVSQMSPDKYRVFTSASTVDIQKVKDNFLCKCPTP